MNGTAEDVLVVPDEGVPAVSPEQGFFQRASDLWSAVTGWVGEHPGLTVAIVLAVILLWIAWKCYRAVRFLRRGRNVITLNPGEDGDYRMTYRAVLDHVELTLRSLYPNLDVTRSDISGHGGKYDITLVVSVEKTVDMNALRTQICQNVQSVLRKNLGVADVFRHVNIVVASVAVDDQTLEQIKKAETASGDSESPSEPQTPAAQ